MAHGDQWRMEWKIVYSTDWGRRTEWRRTKEKADQEAERLRNKGFEIISVSLEKHILDF